jgi:hypothetical protein
MKNSKRLRWEANIACMKEVLGAYKYLIGKREGKRPLGRRRNRWENIIEIYVKVAVTFCGQCNELPVTMQFSRRTELHGVDCLVTMRGGGERITMYGTSRDVRLAIVQHYTGLSSK